ncbi:MAG: FAD-dependent oxidoreductase [Rhizobacter sp.]|nr:FAD-dependent oxidoreductase [Bacteriovorax sp.]
MTKTMAKTKILILGAGPAGLSSAYRLSAKGFEISIIETDPSQVGGLSKTINHNGYLVDIGGHRFFSKSQEVNNFWKEILPDDFLTISRYSRIYYQNIFFDYPLKPFQCLMRLPYSKSLRIIYSFLKSKTELDKKITNLEEWFTHKFGKELYLTFFKSYTEKVWGLKCKEISKDWASQRIQDLSVFSILKNSILNFLKVRPSQVIKTLSTSFLYPRKGPGMFWDRCAEVCKERGVDFHFNTICTELSYDNIIGKWGGQFKKNDQIFGLQNFDYVISSIPVPTLVECIQSINNSQVSDLIEKFKFRDFIMVLAVLKKKNTLKDNWIYIHNENVQVGRIQIFNNWSDEMVVRPDEHTSLGLEFFCQESQGLWNETDEKIIELSKAELLELKLSDVDDNFVETKVIRVKKAYPVYHNNYVDDLEKLKKIISKAAPNVYMIGRNGMHRYNNQDHSIMTAFVVADNIITNTFARDPWKVNQEAVYIESDECSVV